MVLNTIIVFLVSLLIGTLGIYIGVSLATKEAIGFGGAALTALLGALAWGIVSFFLGWLPLVGALLALLAWIGVRQVTALQHDNTCEARPSMYNKTRSCPRRNLLSHHHHSSLHFSHSRSSTIVTRSQYPGDTAFPFRKHIQHFSNSRRTPRSISVPATKSIQWPSSRPLPFWALLPLRPTPMAASPAFP